MISVKRVFRFEAAHFLPDYTGKCKNLHGHSYKLEVEVENDHNSLSTDGMVMDFSILDSIVSPILILEFDHKLINDTLPNPTAENMVKYFHKKITEFLPNDVYLVSLVLWETENCCAIWRQ